MFLMDSNQKGKSLFGSIYHQFEDFFQNVDDFVNKGTVKCVESQVHNVDASVKKLYSDVQNKLPHVVKNVKEQETSPTAKQINVTDDQLVMEQSSIGRFRANESTPNKHQAPQITKTPLTDSSQEKISDLPSGKDDDSSTWNDADYGFEDYITRDLTPQSANTNSDKKISETRGDHNTFMPPMAAPPAILISNAEVSVVRKEMFDGFSHDEDSRSNISADGWLFEDELLPIVKSSDPDEIEAHEENSLAVDPLLSSACNAGHKASIKDGTCCDSFPTDDACVDISYTPQSTEFMFSYFSCDDNEEEETGFVSSTCSALPKTSNIVEFISEDFTYKVENMGNDHIDSSGHASPKATATVEFLSEDFTHEVENICDDHIDSSEHTSPKASDTVEFMSEDFTQKVENICNDHIESNEHACTSSTHSCTTLAYETEAMDMLPHMDSHDVIPSPTSESVSIVGSCQSRSEHCQEDAHSKYGFLPSEIGSSVEFGVNVTDCEMETVDQSNNMTRYKKNLLLNCNFAHPTSHRSRDFRYYKNLVQDAFASRKRLSKEYEHLGILYGDIDMESRLNFELSSLHLCPKSVNEARTRSLDMSECDWELL